MTERCPTCGGTPPLWSRTAIVEAMHKWVALHGRVPGANDWEHGSRWHPKMSTVQYRFGSWSAGIEAAGLIPVTHGLKRPEWTRDTVIRAIRAWNSEHGRPPSAYEWRSPNGSHPSESVVRKRFGSWNLAVVAAGLEPRRVRRRAVA